MTVTERRMDNRLCFPPSLRPELRISGRVLSVLDLSKTGLTFAAPRSLSFLLGDKFSAMLSISGGPAKPVLGHVVRANRKSISIRLEADLPLDLIAVENNRVIRRL